MESESRCALCRKVASLRNSHVMPEFLYDSVYDEHHRFLQVSTDHSERTISRPKGLYERLLCGACESRLEVWETYAARVLKGGVELEFKNEDWGFTVRGVEYAPFKLFGMSLLWRAAASRRPEFEGVQLGPHEEKLRRMIDASDPGRPYEYGFSIVFAPEPKARELFGHVISPPQPARYRAHHVYRFMLGLTFWLFLVSNHMHEVDETIFSLSADGTLRVRSGGQATIDFLRSFSAEIADSNAARDRARGPSN